MWAVVPIKDIVNAKQRLASVLNSTERQTLFRAMVEDVLETLSTVSELDGIMVVTRDPEAKVLAQKYNTRVLLEPENKGHTAAVAHAAQILANEGAEGMMQIPGDLPLMTQSEIKQVLKTHGHAPAMTIVPSRDKKGSNCVLCSPPEVMPLTFGDDSFYPHLNTAKAHGLIPQVLVLPGIGLDIDLPEDLEFLKTQTVSRRTGAFLKAISSN